MDDALVVVAQLGAKAWRQMANEVVARAQVGHLALSFFDFIMLALFLLGSSYHPSFLAGADEDFDGEVSFLAPSPSSTGERCHGLFRVSL